jgi:hypothetical protein
MLKTPNVSRRTSGSSTNMCPKATKKPDFHPSFTPELAVAMVRGPGESAPEAVITCTSSIQEVKSIFSHLDFA